MKQYKTIKKNTTLYYAVQNNTKEIDTKQYSTRQSTVKGYRTVKEKQNDRTGQFKTIRKNTEPNNTKRCRAIRKSEKNKTTLRNDTKH